MGPASGGGGARRRPRALFAAAFAAAGCAVLLGLMTWQLQRLAWKEGLIATLEARLAAPPVPLPAHPDPARDEFLRVTVTGRFTGATGTHGHADAAYLTSARPWGAGYRLIAPFRTSDGRLLLVDRGFLPVAEKNEGGRAARPTPVPAGDATLTAALRWPQAADWFAAAGQGPADNVWLSRDVAALAPLWGAEPLLLVAETPTAAGGRWPEPMPVTVDLPNDHLGYAVTWGALAAVWAGLGALLAVREARRA
jgi:surfeit locus 1 family protein